MKHLEKYMGDKISQLHKTYDKAIADNMIRGDYMFFNGYKPGDIVEINGKDKGIIVHSYVFGSYFAVELLQHGERTGLTQIVHWNEIKKVNE